MYYYSDGVYYVRDGSKYVVVPAPSGVVVQSPPPTYETVTHSGEEYLYANGVYYQETDSPANNLSADQAAAEKTAAEDAARNVDPADIAGALEEPDPFEGEEPPDGIVEGEQPDELPELNYEVVEPPIGAIVSLLPPDTKEENVKGDTYFNYVETWYKPFYSGEDVVYMVVDNPVG